MDESELIEAANMMGPDCLRKGTECLFQYFKDLNIPILVFSAGLGDSVVAILKANNVFLSNIEVNQKQKLFIKFNFQINLFIKVVSNFLVRNDGIIQGLDLNRIIHTFNKNEAALYGSASQKRFERRTNVLLLGDALGDSDMANGCPLNANVLKIGFIWEKVRYLVFKKCIPNSYLTRSVVF